MNDKNYSEEGVICPNCNSQEDFRQYLTMQYEESQITKQPILINKKCPLCKMTMSFAFEPDDESLNTALQ